MYRAPVSDIAFTLNSVAGLAEAVRGNLLPGLTESDVDAVIAGAGRFATDELDPLNRVGDRTGARFADGAVETADGWKAAYAAWRDAGWSTIGAPEEAGGQGLPLVLAAATHELWNGACMAFALCPLLAAGAVEAILKHGSDELKQRYALPIIAGKWTATMNLTEPQSGSDLSGLRTRAERRPDGSYRVFGQKIFITYGEHDLTDNIIHLVLARLPDAPPGSKGISLFLVPKFLVDDEGAIGERNDVSCVGIEQKLGIHGSPTCTMVYGDGRFGQEAGAVGYLVGEENRGLQCMFTMMNNARLMVGIQGVAQAERAMQQASLYAAERRQGRAPGNGGDSMSPIVDHPDVRRTLMTMRSLTAAARAICYSCAVVSDLARLGSDAEAHARVELLTPVAKAFSTEIAVEVASLGVQVHGGMGFIEETGAAQTLRDARILPIYEGTNGIQAIDLVTRKLPMQGGDVVRRYIAELRQIAAAARGDNQPDFGRIGANLSTALDALEDATEHLITVLGEGRAAEALAVATPYLRLFGLAAGGAYLAKGALASRTLASVENPLRIAIARFFAEQLLPETMGLKAVVTDGAAAVLDVEAASLSA